MWGTYLAHKRPEWFAGFILAGSYPLWKDPESSCKCAKQLVQTKVPVSFLFSERDWSCNPNSHPAFFAWILSNDFGPSDGQKAETFQVFETQHSHEYLENVLIGDFKDDAGTDCVTDRKLFEKVWSAVFDGISDKMHSIQIE